MYSIDIVLENIYITIKNFIIEVRFMNKFLKRALELNDNIQCDRQFIHQNAELGNDLPITSGYVKKRLIEMGLEPKEIC